MFQFLFGEEYQEWLASASRVTALKRPVEHLKRSGFVVTKKSRSEAALRSGADTRADITGACRRLLDARATSGEIE